MMLAHKWLLIGAFVFAMLSAAGLGMGLMAVAPILSNIIPRVDEHGNRVPGHDLPEMARMVNQKVGAVIPQGWIDALPTGPFAAVVWIIMGLWVLAIVGALFAFLHSYLSFTVVGRTVFDLRQRCFEHAVHLPLRIVMGSPSRIVAQIVNDTTALSAGLSALVSKSLAQAFKALASLCVAFVTDWRLTLTAGLVAPLLYVVLRQAGKRIKSAAQRGLDSQGNLYSATTEAINNMRVVKSSSAETLEQMRFASASKNYLRSELRVRTVRSLASPLVEALVMIMLGGLSIFAARAILDGALDFQRFIITIAALGFAGNSLRPLTGLVQDLQQSGAAATRLTRFLNLPREKGHDATLPKLARHGRDIVFENCSLTYRGQDRPAVDNVSLLIPHGMTVAFVGPNGSGKTSLLSLIPRLFDPDQEKDGRPAGRVLIDGTDIRTVNVDSLRRQIGVVTQETVLFRGSIKSNILYGVEATDEQVEQAAKRARAHEFILAKPDGYEYEVGERGTGLSGGQRQRLAIARAILRDPAILILDEATSMIDADSEAKIADALNEFSQGRTCLIVAHRLSTVIHADRIVVMDHGRIVDSGAHHELMERCATYRLIAEHQLVRPGMPEPAAAK